MPEVQTGVPGQKLARRYGLKGMTFAPSVEPVIIPVVLVDDLTDELPAVAWAIGAQAFAAAGGLLAQTRLINPAGSGILMENIHIVVHTSGSTFVSLSTGGPSLANTAVPVWQDQRRGGSPVGVLNFGSDVGATTGLISTRNTIFPDAGDFLLEGWVMREGDVLHTLTGAIDQIIRFTHTWTEREETAEEAF